MEGSNGKLFNLLGDRSLQTKKEDQFSAKGLLKMCETQQTKHYMKLVKQNKLLLRQILLKKSKYLYISTHNCGNSRP